MDIVDDPNSNRFDLNDCIEWIDNIQAKYVCLYFLQEFYPLTSRILLNLQKSRPDINFVVTVTCSTGPETLLFRCQDDKQVIDAIIYFGCECLCPERYSKALPVYFQSLNLFNEEFDFIDDCIKEINDNSNVLFVCDWTNSIILSSLNRLKTNFQMISSAKFIKPTQTNWHFKKETLNLFINDDNYKIHHYPYQLRQEFSEYDHVIFIGNCENLELIISCQHLLMINPYKKTCFKIDGAKEFRKRVSLIEKFKIQAKTRIGIVLHDFNYSVSKYLEETKNLCKKSKQIPYFITLNQYDYESRLGNFGQLSGFVMITSCSCNWKISQILSKYIYPCIFWKEFLIACGKNITYGQIKWNDQPELNDEIDEPLNDDNEECENMKLIERSVCQKPDSWYGLIVDTGETQVSKIQEGRKGIASSYKNEQDLF